MKRSYKKEELIEMDDGIIGKHVFGNLYGIKKDITMDKKFLENLVKNAIKIAKMHLVEVKSWKIGADQEKAGGGVSVIALIKESHVAIHVWRKYNYATIDIYTCGDKSKPDVAFDYIVSKLEPKKHKRFYADRSM